MCDGCCKHGSEFRTDDWYFQCGQCEQTDFCLKCVQYIADNGLLPRMVQLRKLIHYFLVEEPADGYEEEKEKKEDSADSRLGARMLDDIHTPIWQIIVCLQSVEARQMSRRQGDREQGEVSQGRAHTEEMRLILTEMERIKRRRRI